MRTLEQELQRHGTALRGLAAALVGEGEADDLLQETALLALRTPPRPGPLGGWLAGVLRHLAWHRRRSGRRRAQHEQAAARREAVPADRSVEDRDTMRALTEAVLALPEPYRDTVIKRYLREQTPGAIAAQDGVPVDTVKSRLQRGIRLLREHLVARGGKYWRLGLASAFGLDDASVTTTGVLVMGTGAKLAWCGTAVALALCALLFLRQVEPQPRASGGATDSSKAVVAKAEAATPAAAEEPGSGRVDARPLAAPSDAAIRGRCLDEKGAPLSGCVAELHGDGPLRASSATDGTFELRCPPTSRQVALRVACSGRDSFARHWPGVRAGQAIDVGDITLQFVRTVRLRLVDSRGRPVPRAWVCPSANVYPFAQGTIRADDQGIATTQLPLGQCRLLTVPRALSETVTIPRGDGPCEVIVPLAQHRDSIDGVVVDEQGSPVQHVQVGADGARGSVVTTGVDGSFALAKDAMEARDFKSEAAVMLTVRASGFEPAVVPVVAWNTHDLRIALQPGTSLVLRVTRRDGTPVDEFSATLWGKGWWSRRHAAGVFPDGVARMAGVVRGDSQVFVAPKDKGLGNRMFVRCTVSGVADQEVSVVLPAVARRTLRVQQEDGSPVSGAGFELVQGVHGKRPTADSWAAPWDDNPSHWDDPGDDPALRLLMGTTNGEGTAELVGPVDEALVLRVWSGERRVLDVRIEDPEPLLVTMSPAGALRGRIGPAFFVQRFRARQAFFRSSSASLNDRPVRVCLAGEAGSMIGTVADDGSFAFASVPAGSWLLTLQYQLEYEQRHRELGRVVVQAGAATVQDFELPELTPGELDAVVTLDGERVDRGHIVLVNVAERTPPMLTARGTTSADGTVRFWPLAATYRVTMQLPSTHGVTLTLPDQVTVTPGASLQATFAFASGRSRLRVLDPQGQPLPGFSLEYEDAGKAVQSTGPTDGDGRLAMRVAPGTYQLFAWRSDMQENETRKEFLSAKPAPEEKAKARFAVGTLALEPGQTVEREIRLPAEWDR